MFEAHKALGDWDAVAELAPSLPDDLPVEVQVSVWRARLGNPREGVDAVEHATEVWRAMPKRLHEEEALLLAYVDVLASRDAAAAEAALRTGIKRRWATVWVLRYGEIRANPSSQLKTASSWLKHHPDDPALLLTLGRLASKAGELPEAKEHLEASLRAESSAATLAELGNLCVANGEQAAANSYFQRALAAATPRR